MPAEPHEHDLAELIREAVDVLDEGVTIYDSEMRLLFADSTSLARFGTVHADLRKGVPWAEANRAAIARLSPAMTDQELDTLTRQFCARLLAGETVDMPSEDGGYARVHYRRMSGGRMTAVSADITDLRKREKELKTARRRAEAASESKSAFLANVSHEIRTPLNGMLGMAQVLASTPLTPEQREHLDAILDSGRTLIALLNDVLDLSKIEAGRLEISPVDTDLAHTLRRLYRLWTPTAEEKGLDLTLDIAASLPTWLKIDAVRVRQCLSNLISNALKFTPRGEVNVHASIPKTGPNAGLVQIKVTDNGIGMTEQTLEQLFTPFTQADASTTRRFGGTGLGLSIARHLAQLMGGDITVKSVFGEGSTFTFTFAATAGEAHATKPASSGEAAPDATQGTRPLSVLVVDDVPLNRKVAKLFLEFRGHLVVEASDGLEALAKLAEAPFDLVLLDVHMPVMDGPETLTRIRESGMAWARIPVIALTANAMSDDRERYLALGMDGYVTKPMDQRDLFSEMARITTHVGEKAA